MDREHDKEKFWSRVGHWFKSSRADPEKNDPIIDSGMGSVAGMEVEAAGTALTSTTAEITGTTSRSRLGRSPAALERIEQEYHRVVGLVESIQDHLGRHTERSEMMVRSLDRLVDSLEHLPEISRNQLDVLESLREEVTAAAQRAVSVEKAVAQLPQLADAQRETMVSISRRMEEARVTDEKLSTTLSGVEQTVIQMGEATDASARTISMMHTEEVARQERIAQLLQQQTDRITWMATIAIAVAVAAVILGLISLFQS